MNYYLNNYMEVQKFYFKKKIKILSGFFLDEIFNKESFSISEKIDRSEKDKNEMLKSLF